MANTFEAVYNSQDTDPNWINWINSVVDTVDQRLGEHEPAIQPHEITEDCISSMYLHWNDGWTISEGADDLIQWIDREGPQEPGDTHYYPSS